MDNIPQFNDDDEMLFEKLVRRNLTLTAIRERMSPTLDDIEDILLIRKMMAINAKGESTDE
jgi:hypothetical protein